MFALGFIGYGEVGRLFAQQLRARCDILAHDIKLADEAAARPLREAARLAGVRLEPALSRLCAGAQIVISAVTADAAETVARNAAAQMHPGQIFFDINSVSPATKSRSAAIFAAQGVDYVEGAVMAPVNGPGIGVPILTGGGAAEKLGQRLNAMGMNLRVVSGEIGVASATKLCRSIMVKGIEALIIDSARACAYWGVGEEVFASLNFTFAHADWAQQAVAMDARVAQHGLRRAAEMREAAQMLEDMGLRPDLVRAVAASLARRAEGGEAHA